MATMRMMAAIAVVAATAGPAAAQSGRYQFEPSGPNVLRLDRETGAIASCSSAEAAWSCETIVEPEAPDAPAASLAEENRRLKARVAVLERRLARIRALAGGAGRGAGRGAAANEAPEDPASFDAAKARRDIDEAVEVTGYAVRQFRGLVEALTAGTD